MTVGEPRPAATVPPASINMAMNVCAEKVSVPGRALRAVAMTDRPCAWTPFVPIIIVTTLSVMNVAVGLTAKAMQQSHHEERSGTTDIHRDEVLRRLATTDSRLSDLDKRG